MYSNNVFSYFNYAFNESKDIKAIWENNYLDSIKIEREHKGLKLIEEVTEYILLDTVSKHLQSYFSSEKISKNKTTVLYRNEISEVITKNNFLDLFSKPKEERSAFINPQESSTDSYFKEFELELPEKSQLIREKDGSITIKNMRFSLNFKINYRDKSPLIPMEYISLFYDLGRAECEQFQFEIKTKIKFNYSTFISNKGWEYYSWLDSLLKNVEDDFCPIKFSKDINWTSNQLLIDYFHKKTVITDKELENSTMKNETYIFYSKSDIGNSIWSEKEYASYNNKYLSTDISKEAIESLIDKKKRGELEKLDVLGVYYKDEGSKAVYKISLKDFIYDDNKVQIKFINHEELPIKSSDLLNFINNNFNRKYNYTVGTEGQLIVCIDKEVQYLVNGAKGMVLDNAIH